MVKKFARLFFPAFIAPFLLIFLPACDGLQNGGHESLVDKIEAMIEPEAPDEYNPLNALLIIPGNPAPGESFRILATGGRNIRKAKIQISGPTGNIVQLKSASGNELPFWRLDNFEGVQAGSYKASLILDKKDVSTLTFKIAPAETIQQKGAIWKTMHGWDSRMETIYSAWVNALFQGSGEQTSWPALHEVMQNKEHNFLYNYLSLGEDDPANKVKVIMEPDCADNPFYLRAYFAWKLGLPFGYHVCDRGYVGKNPGTGQWVTNESTTSKNHPVLAFNSFIRRIMDGVHSGTARTALENENSDYYPVALNRESLRPGTVFADPYGHTFILVSWLPQTKEHPGVLLAVDAQPDKTIAIKRFWKGNFLFNTKEVVGEPGFKAFRPITYTDGKFRLMKNEELNESSGFVPFSLQQKKMESEAFYLAMERVINPKPLDPEVALENLIQALHEQLLVRVKSVANGEAYLKENPGTVISMPSSANGVFLAGGQWENFSTPNRDLRLLIAMDAVLGFPVRVASSPEDFKVSSSQSDIQQKLQNLLEKKVSELSISYIRSDGSTQELTIAEVLQRRDAFEMAYNPNDGIEIRWGAAENSPERSSCKRQAPGYQQKTMLAVRKWFTQRLHPPT
ncbi:MAG: hypothetical protein ACOYN5_02095 [Bacteroidales bacterium]